MRITEFRVEGQRSIALAACASVPPLMAIAGPNGSGKSTLLNALRQVPGEGPILYVPPHRTWRRQQVRQRHLMTPPILFEQLLARSDVPSYEGINLFGGLRDPWSYDDTANYLKHGLCQIEIERKEAIASRYDRDGRIEPGTLPDPWKPLRELTTSLLPHLEFTGVDASNPEAVRCTWAVHGGPTQVDLDDLSSGEKSIIQMFYPLLEHEIRALLGEIRQPGPTVERSDICVLVDEPELHLHPNLQLKVYDYLRLLTTSSHVQVIVATHSPTIVEYASFEELYLLRPAELIGVGENQLVQVASDEERLAFLRDVFGSTANLTALQPVVVVEGSAEDSGRAVSDRKLYRALHPGFDGVTLIGGGGRTEVLALRRNLAAALGTFSRQLPVHALLDRDTDEEGAVEAGATFLPVSMIENFLLDPDAVWEAIQSVVERTTLTTVDDVEAAIDLALDEAEPSEIERRALAALGFIVFRPEGPLAAVPPQAAALAGIIEERFGANAVATARTSGEQATERLRDAGRRRELFHGKKVLNAIFQTHLHRTGLQKAIFKFEAARYARRRRAVVEFFNEFFAGLPTMVPTAPLPGMARPADQTPPEDQQVDPIAGVVGAEEEGPR